MAPFGRIAPGSCRGPGGGGGGRPLCGRAGYQSGLHVRLFGRHGLAAIALKAQLATAVLALAALQLLLVAWMYLPGVGPAPRAVPQAYRITGFAAFALTVPVAVHCLFAYGVQLTGARVAIHSVAAAPDRRAAFAAKVLIVRSGQFPRWSLPLAGGGLIVVITVVWYTAALWYYYGFHLPGT